MRESRLDFRSPESDRTSSRLARDGASIRRCAREPLRRGARKQGFLPICVSSTYFEKGADGGQFGAREVAESSQLGHAELGLQQPFPGEAVEVRGRNRR